MNENIFAENLIRLRTEKSLTQEEASAALGISNKTLSKWENGSSSPDLDMLVKLAQFYDTTTDSLLGISDSGKKSYIDVINEEFDQLEGSDVLERTFSMHFDTFCSLFRRLDGDSPVIPEKPWDFSSARSKIQVRTFFDFMVASDDVNMSVTLYGNRNNWSWLDSEEKRAETEKIFTFLANDNALRLCKLIHTDGFPGHFTADYIASLLGVTEEDAAVLLEKSCEIKLCTKETAHLMEGEKNLYVSWGDGKIMSLIALAFEHMTGHESYNYCYGGPAKMITKGEE